MTQTLIGIPKKVITQAILDSNELVTQLKQRNHNYVLCVTLSKQNGINSFIVFLNSNGALKLNIPSFTFQLTQEFIDSQLEVYGGKVNPAAEFIINYIDEQIKALSKRDASAEIDQLQNEGFNISNIEFNEKDNQKSISISVSPSEVTTEEIKTYVIEETSMHYVAICSLAENTQNNLAYSAGRYIIKWLSKVLDNT